MRLATGKTLFLRAVLRVFLDGVNSKASEGCDVHTVKRRQEPAGEHNQRRNRVDRTLPDAVRLGERHRRFPSEL